MTDSRTMGRKPFLACVLGVIALVLAIGCQLSLPKPPRQDYSRIEIALDDPKVLKHQALSRRAKSRPTIDSTPPGSSGSRPSPAIFFLPPFAQPSFCSAGGIEQICKNAYVQYYKCQHSRESRAKSP